MRQVKYIDPVQLEKYKSLEPIDYSQREQLIHKRRIAKLDAIADAQKQKRDWLTLLEKKRGKK